jgi:hypothetical protein
VSGPIVTVDESQPNTRYLNGNPARAVLPDGRVVRLGYTVTGSYWKHDDVRGVVVGWNRDRFVVDIGAPSSIELGPAHILTIEEVR